MLISSTSNAARHPFGFGSVVSVNVFEWLNYHSLTHSTTILERLDSSLSTNPVDRCTIQHRLTPQEVGVDNIGSTIRLTNHPTHIKLGSRLGYDRGGLSGGQSTPERDLGTSGPRWKYKRLGDGFGQSKRDVSQRARLVHSKLSHFHGLEFGREFFLNLHFLSRGQFCTQHTILDHLIDRRCFSLNIGLHRVNLALIDVGDCFGE